MNLRPVGTSAVLVEVADAGQALALSTWLHGLAAAGEIAADEIVPAAATVLVDGCWPPAVGSVVRRWTPSSSVVPGPLVELAVDYDGPDLVTVASLVGLAVPDLVAAHTAVEHVVAFCGFAPGFGYLSGAPWSVPRLASPRARVPAGSVALAGTWTGVYPSASPGGWQLIGRTDAVLWDPSRPAPALLAPGTRVRFVPR